MHEKALRVLDSYASLLVLLLANFFLLELVDDRRWGSVGSTLLGAAALVVAISEPSTGHTIRKRDAVLIVVAVGLSLLLLFTTSDSLVGLSYLIPVVLLVSATLPVTIARVLAHKQVTAETILGSVCIFVLVGLMFGFIYLAIDTVSSHPFFQQAGTHDQGEFLYFSFVVLTTLGFGDLAPTEGLPQALVVVEALLGSIFLVTLVSRLVTLWGRQSAAGD
jgi:ion channel